MNLNAVANNPFAASTPEPAKKELGKDDFLRLLTTQLSNQDPLKPVDNQEFIAQLAQFASVEQMNRMGTSLESLLVAQGSANRLAVSGLVGKDVAFRTDTIQLGAEGPAKLTASVPADGAVTFVIQDTSGKTVRTLAAGDRKAGALEVEWDGRDDTGQRLAPGSYRVIAAAKGADGAAVPVDLLGKGRVSGVSFDGSEPTLLVGGARVALPDVYEIHQA